MSRFKSDKTEEMVKNARAAKVIFEKHGAEFLRMSRFHTGVWAGEWLVVTRYPSWAAYGKAQEGLSTQHIVLESIRKTLSLHYGYTEGLRP
jgi:hypothetical protein